jgi:hypothetical protein
VRASLASLFAALVASGAFAQERPPPPPEPPLSREDAELVKELALLEKMELVKNLELFEKDKEPPPEEPPPHPPQPPQRSQ